MRDLGKGRRGGLRAAAGAAGLLLIAAGCGSPSSPAAAETGRVPQPAHAGITPGPARLVDTTHADGAVCGDYRLPVTAGPLEFTLATSTYQLAVRLCGRGRWAGQPTEILVGGAGYDGRVWSLGPDWVRHATAGGVVTAQVDLLGTGASDHPAGATLTYAVQAWVIHVLAQDLDNGVFGFVPSAPAVLVGHSVGGYAAWMAAARWGADFSGLVLVDAAHTRRAEQVAKIQAAQHPATADPRTSHQPWAAAGYLVLAAGSRCGLFYAGSYDPAVCRADEATFGGESIPSGELTGLAAVTTSTATKDIHVPVLVVLGDRDPLFCGAAGCAAPDAPVRAECSAWYPNAASCGYAYVASAGHDSMLHREAPAMFGRVAGWLHQTVLGGRR